MDNNFFGPKLVAGDTWRWRTSVVGYSAADGYTAKVFFRGPKNLDVEATADGGEFVFEASAAATADLFAGGYSWQLVVLKGEGATLQRVTIAKGTVEVEANTEASQPGDDNRSWAEQALDKVRRAIVGRADRTDLEYTVNGRMLRSMSPQMLIDLEGYLVARVRREKIAAGQLPRQTNQIHGGFGDVQDPVLLSQWKKFPGGGA